MSRQAGSPLTSARADREARVRERRVRKQLEREVRAEAKRSAAAAVQQPLSQGR